MKLQVPAPLAIVTPVRAPSINTCTVAPISVVPLKVGRSATVAPAVGAMIVGADGGVVSMVQL
ncbi:hypothetical protein D3C81_2046140 [compost metagenome]